jgi:hypothetical protein
MLATVFAEFFAAEPNDRDANTTTDERLVEMSRYAPDILASIMDAWLDVAKRMVAASGQSIGVASKTAATLGRSSVDALDAYRLVLLLARPGMAWFSLKTDVQNWFSPHHQAYLQLIRAALLVPDHVITTNPTTLDTGRWTDVVHALIGFYRDQLGFGDEAEAMQRDAAILVPEAIRRFPDQHESYAANLLEHHPDGVAQLAGLVRFYVLERGDPSGGPMEWLAHEIHGRYASRDNFSRKNGTNILKEALKDAPDWPEPVACAFIDRFVLPALGADPLTAAKAAADVKQSIDYLRRTIAARPKPPVGMSAADDAASMRKWLAENETQLARIESDFAGWQEARLQSAAKTLAQSTQSRKAADMVVANLPTAATEVLRDIFARAAVLAARPKLFPMPKPSDNRFKDFGLKLLVIEEVMYKRDWLTPRFDIRQFAEEWDAREISVDDDGYSIIPEAKRYFQNLAISDELLARVETLHQSSGMDGGSGFIDQLWPFFDPGCGDEPVPVTAKAIEDLALLPNLRTISGLENSKPGKALLKALAARDITLIDEETATFGQKS